MSEELCENCRFWVTDSMELKTAEINLGKCEVVFRSHPLADSEGYVACGECHRGPPSCGMHGVSWLGNMQAVWPVTLPSEWCGEWQAKSEPTGSRPTLPAPPAEPQTGSQTAHQDSPPLPAAGP